PPSRRAARARHLYRPRDRRERPAGGCGVLLRPGGRGDLRHPPRRPPGGRPDLLPLPAQPRGDNVLIPGDLPGAGRQGHRPHPATCVRLLGPPETVVQVPPHATARTAWDFRVETPGTALFTATAVSRAGPRDGVQLPVPVVPHGSESRAGLSGEFAGDAAALP